MKNKSIILIAITISWVAAFTFMRAAIAQSMTLGEKAQQAFGDDSSKRPPLVEITLESSYAAATTTTFRGAEVGESDASNINIGLKTRIPLNGHWVVPLEVRSQNLYLGTLADTPLPASINTIQLGTGLGYRPGEHWMFMAHVNPTFYRLSDFGSNDVGVSGSLMAMWNYSPSLKIMLGVIYSPDSDLSIMPLAGFDWTINNHFDLQMMFPRPRLIYILDEKLHFHIGAEMNLITFSTNELAETTSELAQYNDALATYRDIRLGTGINYRFSESFSTEAEAGYSVNRQIDYTEIDERVAFDSGPYVRLGLRMSF